MRKQAHVYYSGRVQGVGFRFTVIDIARTLKICGWVKNLGDGRVEMLIEAPQEALNIFLERIKDYFTHYIREVQVEWLPATGEFKDFNIAF